MEYQLTLARDLKYASRTEVEDMLHEADALAGMIFSLRRKVEGECS